METPGQLQQIYQSRFAAREEYRRRVWRVLIERLFGRWIRSTDAVLDLGCGYGEFVNQVTAAKKYGMDMNPATRSLLAEDVQFLEQDCSQPWAVPGGSLDVVFSSNFFEHLPDKACLGRCLEQALAPRNPGGHLIAMGPNIAVV